MIDNYWESKISALKIQVINFDEFTLSERQARYTIFRSTILEQKMNDKNHSLSLKKNTKHSAWMLENFLNTENANFNSPLQ